MLYVLAFIFVLLTPVAMFSVGLFWQIKPPKIDTNTLSYRTIYSTRSQETWDFAHHQISRMWVRIGIISGIIASVLMVVLKDNYTTYLLWIVGGEMVFLCISAFLVDLALKNGFDENGKRL